MAPKNLLQGKVALVTGGGSGFGEGVAKLFAEEGAKVIIGDISKAGGEKVVSEIKAAGLEATFFFMDVTSKSAWNEVVDHAQSTYGGLDILINNAGWTYRLKDTLLVTETEYDRIWDINMKSIFYSVNHVLPHFLERGRGSIVNICSCITCNPTPGLLWYGATKAALEYVTRGLAKEFSSKGVRVNGILPSMGFTSLVGDFLGTEPTAEIKKQKEAEAPLGRLCTPQDIAKAALYFSSDYFNDFETGILLRVDGGNYT